MEQTLPVLTQSQAVAAVSSERRYQDLKWGTILEHPHTAAEWLLIIEGELTEAKQEWQKGASDQKALAEVVQICAVALACIEQHGAGYPRFGEPPLYESAGHWAKRMNERRAMHDLDPLPAP